MLAFHLVNLLSTLFSQTVFPSLEAPREVLHTTEALSPWPDSGLLMYSDDCGQVMTVGWEGPLVVGLVFDHESCNSEAAGGRVKPEDYRPLQWFAGELPPQLLPLATSLATRIGDLTTAGFFAIGEGPVVVTTDDSAHTHDWFGILTGRFDAQLHSILPEQLELCKAIASDLRESRRTLSEDERRLLLTLPPEWASEHPCTPDAAVLARALAHAGVDWGT